MMLILQGCIILLSKEKKGTRQTYIQPHGQNFLFFIWLVKVLVLCIFLSTKYKEFVIIYMPSLYFAQRRGNVLPTHALKQTKTNKTKGKKQKLRVNAQNF